MTPLEIARLEERRQGIATTEIADEGQELAGGYLAFGGAGSWVNQAVGLGLDGAVSDADLDTLVDYYTSRGVEPRIEVCAFAHDTLLRGLADRGFVLREFENVYARLLSADEAIRDQHPHGWPAVEMVRVDPDNEQQVHDHAFVSSSGFVEGAPSETMLRIAKRTCTHPRTTAFNAVVDGNVVGAGAMEVSEGVATLFGTSVNAEYRRQGIQLALILERLAHAQACGCRLVTIHSRPGIPTERNSERVGFALSYTKVVLVKPGEGLVPSP